MNESNLRLGFLQALSAIFIYQPCLKKQDKWTLQRPCHYVIFKINGTNTGTPP